MNKCIFKIKINNLNGSGFFVIIQNKDDWNAVPTRVLMTNNHIIGQDSIKVGKKIPIFLKNKKIDIYIDNNRNTYTNENLDVTIIEIKQSDGISCDSFLEIDQNIFKDNPESIFENCPIYLLHYPKVTNPNKSDGVITQFNKFLEIYHTCCSYGGSSGGALLNLNNLKLIGIHKGASLKNNYNIGILLKLPIEEFNKKVKSQSKNKIEGFYYIEKYNKLINLLDDLDIKEIFLPLNH